MNPLLRIAAFAAVAVSSVFAGDEKWIPIFNGKDLDGWTPKIRGYELGEDPKKTFVVRDGALTVTYENYDEWGDAFGHIYYKTKYSNYRIRLEYRFIGEPAKDAPAWAAQNSGIMLHCQDPKTIGKDQRFPVSLEFQLLGTGSHIKTTGNLCTPGTYVSIGGQVNKTHCINAKPPTLPPGQWVKAEAEVRGGKLVKHFINGELAMEYTDAKLDENDSDAAPLIEMQGGNDLVEGYISLQSESHPCQFRNIEILELDP